MNLTSQYIANPKSRYAYTNSLAPYKSIRTTSTRLRIIDHRCILKPNKNIYFKIDNIQFKMIRCSFLLGDTEVTQELFEKIMGYNPSNFQGKNYPNSKQRPVEQVTWYDAVVFCNKLSEKLRKKLYYNVSNVTYEDNNQKTNIKEAIVTTNPQANGFRLPYEKEWEYAAKAGTNNQWAGTNDINKVKDVAWFEDNSEDQTHPIKCKNPNEWGFYDMSGNVREWCYDLYDPTLVHRVIRGGGWYDDASDFHSADRYGELPGYRFDKLGFRVSASLVN